MSARRGESGWSAAQDQAQAQARGWMLGRASGWALLLAAGVALSAWQWHEVLEAPAGHDGHSHLHDDAGKPARLYAWNADQAARIVLSSPTATLTLVRGEPGWLGPAKDDTTRFDPADFVSLFSQARSDRILTPHPGESYGLDPAALRITVLDAAGAELARMDVGALAPDGLGRYVQLPGEAQIRIIPDYQTRAPLAAIQGNPNADEAPAAATLALVKPGLRKDK